MNIGVGIILGHIIYYAIKILFFLELMSINEGKVQVRVLRHNDNSWPPKSLRDVSIPHGYTYLYQIVQVKKSLLCPEWLNCKWCIGIVDKAITNICPNFDTYY